MNGREKIEAAFSAQGTPRFGAVIPYEGIFVRDHWRQVSGLPWWYPQSPDLSQVLAWRRDVARTIGQDWFALPLCSTRSYRRSHRIIEREGRVFLRDEAAGRERELFEPTADSWGLLDPGYTGHVEHIARTTTELDELIPPTEPFDPQAMREEGQDELARLILADFGADLYPIEHVLAPLWNCFSLWGFEGMMEMVALRPELVEDACRRFLQPAVEHIRRAAALGTRGIWIEDCLTDLIHPRDFARVNVPFVAALVEEIRSLGMHSIHYFCGSPAGKLDLLLSTGIDTLSLEESKKGFTIDIAAVAEAVDGRCALLGNLDAIHLLPHASEDDLRAEIARQAQAGRRNRGRFVMSLGSPVTPGTSPERVRLYCEMARDEK